MADRGLRSKLRTHKDGRTVGGKAFTKGALAHLLKNPVYLGKVQHRGELHEGQHEAIVDQQLWNATQAVSVANGRDRLLGRRLLAPSLLVGILTDPQCRPMTPVHTSRIGRRYRYYVSRLAQGEDRKLAWRVPAGELDQLVVDAIRNWLLTVGPAHGDDDAVAISAALSDRGATASTLPFMTKPEQREVLLALGARVQTKCDAIEIELGGIADAQSHPPRLHVTAALVKKGAELRFAIPPDGQTAAEPDPALLKLVAQARAAETMLVAGKDAPTVHNYGKAHLCRLLRINWLAPDILSAIIEGRQPVCLTGRRLLRASQIPLDWTEQRRMFGFA